MHYCKGIDKKGVLLREYAQSAIRHAPYFLWVTVGKLFFLYVLFIHHCVTEEDLIPTRAILDVANSYVFSYISITFPSRIDLSKLYLLVSSQILDYSMAPISISNIASCSIT